MANRNAFPFRIEFELMAPSIVQHWIARLLKNRNISKNRTFCVLFEQDGDSCEKPQFLLTCNEQLFLGGAIILYCIQKTQQYTRIERDERVVNALRGSFVCTLELFRAKSVQIIASFI